MSESIKIIFVLPLHCQNEAQTSKEMQQAYEVCKQNSIDVNWCNERECSDLQLKKTDILVFQSFQGAAFETAKTGKSVRIVGPWCLSTCLTFGQKIPNLPWPIFSIAMNDCMITTSALQKHLKKDLQTKIESMAGYFSASLTGNSTHLITDSVKSEKYIKAAESKVKIMLSSWVDDVWQYSLQRSVHCNDEEFEKHRCPVFHKLVVCCTGFNNILRLEIETTVKENGGVYKEQLHINNTDFLICENNNSAKYKAALKHSKIKRVTISWVRDSVKSGYALSDKDYLLEATKTSTPSKGCEDEQPNFSMISTIGNMNASAGMEHMNTIDTTNMATFSNLTPDVGLLKRKSPTLEHNELVNGIDLKRVKMARGFLDGCGIYIVGFAPEQHEKLNRVINSSGATRYDDICERVTHVIVGDTKCHEFKVAVNKITLSNCVLVNINWLLDSIYRKQPVDEGPYTVSAVVSPSGSSSPLSKKGLHLLRTTVTTPTPDATNVATTLTAEPEVDIVQQYLNPQTSQEDTLANLLKDAASFDSQQKSLKPTTSILQNNFENHNGSLSSAVDDSSQNVPPIFSGLKFAIAGFDEEPHKQIVLAIETLSGKVVSKLYKGIPDYAVLPLFSSELQQTAQEIVNDLWISECWQEHELRAVEYFHKPVSIKDEATPLENCVVSLSTYVNYERNFLKNLIIQLGGICQEQFSRKNCPDIVASTHLVSSDPVGKKYLAALRWNLPVVNKDWLLECARLSCFVDETPFLVGDAKCTKKVESLSDTSKMNLANVTSNKVAPISTSSIESPVENHELEYSDKAGSPSAGDFTNTPPSIVNLNSSKQVQTPVNKFFRNVASTSGVCSQITPVQKIIAEARKNNLLGTPQQSNPRPRAWDHVDTPDTPLGAFIRPNPSPKLRKEMVKWLNHFPESRPRRNSTPLSELKRQLWDKICPPGSVVLPSQPNFDCESAEEQNDSVREPSTPARCDAKAIHQIEHLHEILATNSANRSDSRNLRRSVVPVSANEIKDSQPNTIGWEDFIDSEFCQSKSSKAVPIFMFSGIEQGRRESLTSDLEKLGVAVTNLTNFDPLSTHLICSKLSRNEKTLASIAAGKWILHTSYADQCIKERKLLDEEPFEYGNPKSLDNIHMQTNNENSERENTNYYWRKEIERRGYGAFHDMKVLVFSERKDCISRIIQAGGGVIVNASIPFNEQIHATHCLFDFKCLKNIADYIPLAQQGILCVNTLYVNDFLRRTVTDVKDYINCDLLKYYDFN